MSSLIKIDRASKIRTLSAWVLAYFLMFYWTYPNLPQKLATQFNYQGQAVSYMSKTQYLYFMIFMIVIMLSSFFLMRIFIRPSTLKTPRFNIPWKKYWLKTDERTFSAYLILDRFLYITGTGANLLIVMSHVLIMNQNGLQTLVPISLNFFLICTLVFVLALILFGVFAFRPKEFDAGN